MSITDFCARRAAAMPDATAPDGSEVRLLCATARGSMALFTLAPGMVSRAVAHRSVEEIWYVARGRGRMWRCDAAREEIVELGPGLSIAIRPEPAFSSAPTARRGSRRSVSRCRPGPAWTRRILSRGFGPRRFKAG